MSDKRFHLVDGETAREEYRTCVDPGTAGWDHCSLRVLDLPPGRSHTFDTGDSEWIVLPLSGSCSVTCDDRTFELAGRASVFAGVSDFAYAPRDARVRIDSGTGGRFALTGARCRNRLPARYGPASGVPVELRGAGQASRQVNNFGAAHVFEADRLIAVEVLTPAGNWSSFPPHKHDEDRAGESRLEEIYYFEIAEVRGTPGIGYQRVSPSGPGSDTDVLAEVRSGDVVLIPDGWHGPSMAVPGYDMYYLNVMAGPSPERAWLICDDPAHAWVRETWADQPVDARLPFYRDPSEVEER
ncbi:5-deoxy-glucuronate isomerase [Saccharopolyspora flava]|uniref:5-deoxyglucuronate isomerase n=1 Tax=Saccharopolyspora flava TaxID=95161 RepID=A0A1I6SBG4_9PSEU|nr:5-deoxy-glucuronate isomerase [Saccharopolyspora flava]SFS74253.1 5-deoxyglucuronate isomerase [Saccharopolyspora flava]